MGLFATTTHHMRTIFLSIILLLGLTSSSFGQVKREIHETFDAQPPHWSWANEYSDANLQRKYAGGMLNFRVTSKSNYWSLAYRPIDARFDWSASLTATIDEAATVEGLGVMVVSKGRFYMFYIAGGSRAIWLGLWEEKTNTWTTISKNGPESVGYRTCECVRQNGRPNVLSVYGSKGRVRFAVNDTTVEDLPLTGDLSALAGSIDAVGIVVSGLMSGRVDRFDATYTERPLPIVPNAFIGARKTLVKELVGPGSRYPVMSPNGQQLYYILSDSATSDNIYVTDALTDSTWTKGRNIGTPLNNSAPNNITSVSQDGNELFLWGRYNKDGSSNGGGFSTSRRTADGWSVPEPIEAPPYVNRASSREECLSADRSVMLLTRDLEGSTLGEKDIYVSFRNADGSYGPLTNLGRNVNSPGNEGGPYLAADGKTLYFNSSYDTYGSDDVFVSKRLDDTWLNWSPRMNLGPTINSPTWDSYFCIHPSGKYAYVNSSDGFTDGIMRVDLPQDAASRSLLPEAIVIVKGRVLNAKTKEPLGVTIRYEDLATNMNIGSAVSEPSNGAYSVVLTGGHSYGFFAEKQGFFPVSDNIDLPTIKTYQVIERDLYLEPIAVGSVIRLNNLFFDTDRSELRQESGTELQRLIAMLGQYPGMKISIEGHTDDRGTDAHNNVLSQARADAVLAYLGSKGIPPSRLSAKGYGKTRPVVKGTKDADRQKNRRVDFRITEM